MDGFKKRLSESVQLRLSVALSLAILVVALVAGVFAFISAYDEANEMQDDTLRQVAVLVDRQQMSLSYPSQLGHIEGDNEEDRVVVQYLADGAKATHGGDNALPLPLPTDLRDGLYTLDVGGEPFRVLVKTTIRGERIAVAQESGARDQGARENALRSLLPFLILFPVLLLVATDLIRKMFRPIAQLSAEIDQRAEHALHPIDEQHLPSEVRPFVIAINRLLTRVEQSMESQRRFVADAAHELRSPMTALSLQAERLAAADLSPVAQQRLLPLRRGIERGRKLIDQLLTLARAQSSVTQAPSSVSVFAVYRRVLEDLLPLAEAKNIDIGVEGELDLHVMISDIDLTAVVKNLVDNAIRYTPEGGRIDLAVSAEGDRARLIISDTGPGIAPAERQRVFDPFYRSLGGDEVGSGLGLSIVQTIIERSGAEVKLGVTNAGTGLGLRVEVWVPRV